jgi:hypothetical protein
MPHVFTSKNLGRVHHVLPIGVPSSSPAPSKRHSLSSVLRFHRAVTGFLELSSPDYVWQQEYFAVACTLSFVHPLRLGQGAQGRRYDPHPPNLPVCDIAETAWDKLRKTGSSSTRLIVTESACLEAEQAQSVCLSTLIYENLRNES